jgi:23S rRNA (pseudouridine1915-N3)-methyltransferase
MRLVLQKQGKVVLPGIRDLCQMYETRLRRFHEVECVEQKGGATSKPQKSQKAHASDTLTVALDEKGAQWTSRELAAKMQAWTDDPRVKSVRFVVGDAHGLSQDVRDAADFTWALSGLTLQGDLAWLLLWEQVYRAVTLNKGIPYHHD